MGPRPGIVARRRASGSAFWAATMRFVTDLDPFAQIAELVGQQVERRPGGFGRLPRRLEQPIEIVDALRHDDPELGQMRADRVHGLGLLPDEEVPALWSRSAACRSADFTGTNRIVGRVTASQIASASAASVFPRFT
jgi:hypothetical protein